MSELASEGPTGSVRWKVVLCGALTGLLLAACSSGNDEAGAVADEVLAVGAGLGSSGATGGTLEELSPSQRLLLADAETELTRRCMEEAGFDYVLPRRTVNDFTGGSGFRTADQLEAGGYGVKRVSEDGSSPNDKILAKLPSKKQGEWKSALYGGIAQGKNTITMREQDGTETEISRDGCLSEARIAIYGSLEGFLSLDVMQSQLGGGAYNQVWGNADYQEAAEKWRTCMRQQGVDPGEHADYGWSLVSVAYDLEPSMARQQEKKIQAADAACMRETGIDALRGKLLKQIAAETAAKKGLNVAGANAFQQAALVRAGELVKQ